MLFDDSSTSGVRPTDQPPGCPGPVWRDWEVLHDGSTTAGIREMPPGRFRADCAGTEFTHILSGRAILHQEGGADIAVGPGASFTLRRGFRGVWEVTETLRREYLSGA